MIDSNNGPDRRLAQRRILADRRQEIRWEPDKPDRRQGLGRRKEDGERAYWNL
ncbi:hypothetical protein [Gallaecimonas sp. GXIMD4217]|uniref:hypothetical protein n=1 Tax=Gallaecimonas sp. GXIMD4217 TaxID=3131927 RepID=UPI00311B2D5A